VAPGPAGSAPGPLAVSGASSSTVAVAAGVDASVPGRTRAAAARSAVRSAAAAVCALAIVASVIPLVVLQIPDAIAWALPPRLAGQGPGVVASVLRASGLALPAMAVAAPLAALAVRWLQAGPVLLAGLLVIAAADLLGDTAGTVALIGVDRSLHGLGAGIAMTAVVAVVAEQPKAKRPQTGRRSLAGWWAALTVAGLAAAPELMRRRVTSGHWHAELQPSPWLTGTALALAALYALLAEGTAAADARSAFPPAERAQLALLAAPMAGICAIAVAVTYRGDKAVAVAAIADALALTGIVAVTARASTAARLAVVCAVAGFTLAPAAGAVTALTQPTEFGSESGGVALAAALCGATLALMTKNRHVRAVTAVGLFLAAAGFAALYLAGPENPHSRMLAALCVPLAGGLSAALAAGLRATGAAGAMASVVMLLAGVVAGYLAAGAVQLRALADARTAQAVRGALVTAAGHWALVAAAVSAAAALAMACTPGRWPSRKPGHPAVGRRKSKLSDVAGGAPVPGAGGTPGHG
jgi:hypothetical protein